VLRRVLSDRPIAFHPELARAFGGINEALFVQQIAYWSDKGDDPEWIYKSQVELEAETCLSAYQQKQARDHLKRLGVLQDARRGRAVARGGFSRPRNVSRPAPGRGV
jgi:hypothetical protein